MSRQLAHDLVASSPFRVTTPADADREKRGDYPDRNIAFGNHEEKKSRK